jgi:hypothetical protein
MEGPQLFQGSTTKSKHKRVSEVLTEIRATGNLVKSVLEKENRLEETVFGGADHRLFAASRSQCGDQGTVQATLFHVMHRSTTGGRNFVGCRFPTQSA